MGMERAEQYRGKVTYCVVIASIFASFIGLLFGYSGILGQISWQETFYDLFLLDVSGKNPREYDYCKYSNRYDFPLYGGGPLCLAAALGSLLSYPIPIKYGRRMSIIIAGVISFVGAALGVYPVHLALILLNQIILGFGLGFGIQVTLLYLSEIAPARFRGGLNMIFQLATTLGALGGNMIKSNADDESSQVWIFYLAFALPVVPALIFLVGGIKLLPETPNSLVERGSLEEGRKVLAKIRGTEDVEAEFQDIVDASEFTKVTRQNHHFVAVKNIFRRRNRPQLVMAVLIPIFQNLTGIVFVLFYAPLMFWSLGSRYKSSFYSSAVNGSILVVSTILSMAFVDKIGRRFLLISGGVLMILSQVIIAIILGTNLLSDLLTTDVLSIVVTVLISIFVLNYGLSWGPLGWTIPSEIFTLETRAIGQSISVSMNLVTAYLVLQFFVPLLCVFKYGLFLFFGCWIVLMTVFVCLFLPETKGVPIEEMGLLWTKHWFWNRFVCGDDSQVLHVAPNTSNPKHV